MVIPEFCTKYRSEAQKALCLKRSWNDFDPQAYYLYGEDQNHETSFKGKALQAAVDSWCKIQVIIHLLKGPLDMKTQLVKKFGIYWVMRVSFLKATTKMIPPYAQRPRDSKILPQHRRKRWPFIQRVSYGAVLR